MKLLILGGTRFLGRHLVTAALARDHEVTLFNRGNYPEGVPSGVETIRGNRHSDLAKLKGRRWDAVVDTSGMLPRTVRAAADVLLGAVDRYVFISSQNVYPDVSVPGVDETAPIATLTNEQLQEANEIDSSGQASAANYGKLYGGLKALCEQAAEEVMPGRVLRVRPGLIVGPYDYTDRFTYWVMRVARGGEVLAPSRPDYCVQFIDARDLSEWIVNMIERKEAGVYNANGRPGALTMRNVLDECRAVSHSDASFTWASEEFLIKEGVAAWTQLPLWLPEDAAPHLKGFMFVNCDKAFRAGLNVRSVTETIRDTLSWAQKDRTNEKLKAGLDLDQENTLLRKWHQTDF